MTGCYYTNLESQARCQGANRGRCSRCDNPYCSEHGERGLCDKCKWKYDDPLDLSLPGYKRFYPFDPTFPLSISFPQAWSAKLDRFNLPDSIFVDFSPSSTWLVSVVRWNYSSEGYDFRQPRTLHEQVEREVARLYSRTADIAADAVRHWVEWPGEKGSRLKRFFTGDNRPDYLKGPAFLGEMATPYPRVIYQSPQGQYGEVIFFLRTSDSPYIMWKLLKQPSSEISREVFQTMLKSVRWLSSDFFRQYGITGTS
jgi:hypothetical protein